MTDAKTQAAWREAKRQILLGLNLCAEYESLGLRLDGSQPNAKGWISAFSPGVEDRTPSAGINVADGPLLGHFHDFRDAENCSFFDYCLRVRPGRYADVLKHYAAKTGVKLPNGDEERTVDRLEFRTPHYSQSHLGFGEKQQYAKGKAGVTVAAIDSVGCLAATWPRGLSPEKQNQLLVVPMYGSSLLHEHEPTGFHCAAVHPHRMVRKFQGKDRKDALLKTLTLGEYGLMGLDGLKRLAEATVVNIVEGLTDLLAVQAALIAARAVDPQFETHVVVSSGACTYKPRAEWMPHFAGKEVRVWGDVGDPKNEGQIGAAVWTVNVLETAKLARNVLLPLGKDGGKNDVRAWLTEPGAGRGYVEMDQYARSFPALTEPDDELKKLASSTRPNTVSEEDDRPEIELSLDEFLVNQQAADALGRDQAVFQRGGMLVHLIHDDGVERNGIRRAAGLPRIVPLPTAILRERLTTVAKFVKVSKTEEGEERTRVVPPSWCIHATHQRGQWPSVRSLTGIVNCPTLRPNGTILSTPGYDQETGLYLAVRDEFPTIPDRPEEREVIAAGELLQHVVCDFPFKSLEHKVGWIAFVLTLLSRHAFEGPVPLFLFDANCRGSGKGKLADAAALIATGFEMSATAFPDTDAEMRKCITSLAINGDSVVMLDNIAGDLGGPALEAAVTARRWRDRILGGNQVFDGPLTVVWCATGNNVVLKDDTPRRTLPIRLESPMENPEDRSGFTHPDLLAWIRSERPRLVAAGLTILRGYCAAGRPKQDLPPWGSFDAWSDLIRAALYWAGLPDPCASRRDFTNRSDSETGALRSIVSALAVIAPRAPGFTCTELLDIAAGKRYIDEEGQLQGLTGGEFQSAEDPIAADLRSAMLEFCPASRGNDLPSAKSLGRRFTRAESRVVGGMAIRSSQLRGGKLGWFAASVES